MKEINKIIGELIELKDYCGERIEEIIYDNMNYSSKYEDLTTAEIKEINDFREKIRIIYDAIGILDKIKEE